MSPSPIQRDWIWMRNDSRSWHRHRCSRFRLWRRLRSFVIQRGSGVEDGSAAKVTVMKMKVIGRLRPTSSCAVESGLLWTRALTSTELFFSWTVRSNHVTGRCRPLQQKCRPRLFWFWLWFNYWAVATRPRGNVWLWSSCFTVISQCTGSAKLAPILILWKQSQVNEVRFNYTHGNNSNCGAATHAAHRAAVCQWVNLLASVVNNQQNIKNHDLNSWIQEC